MSGPTHEVRLKEGYSLLAGKAELNLSTLHEIYKQKKKLERSSHHNLKNH